MRITGVRTITCDIPLPHPIVMGELRFDSREYVLVVIETDSGARGVGFGMTRDAPIGAISCNLAPRAQRTTDEGSCGNISTIGT